MKTATGSPSPLFHVSFPSLTSLAPHQARSREHFRHGGWEGGGAVVGPLAGERVPHVGERAVVERMRDGALLVPKPQGSGGPSSTWLVLTIRPVRAKAAPAAVVAR
jgi:hypothetical protein